MSGVHGGVWCRLERDPAVGRGGGFVGLTSGWSYLNERLNECVLSLRLL